MDYDDGNENNKIKLIRIAIDSDDNITENNSDDDNL